MTAQSAPLLYQEGNALFKEGRYREAADRYREALVSDPLLAEASFNLGCAADRLAGPAAALPHFARAVAQREEWGGAHASLGFALARLGRLEEALVHFRKGAALEPRDAGVRNNLGLALSLLDKPQEAEAALKEALALNPRYAQPYNNLSVLYERYGRTAEAIAAAHAALAIDPAFPEALNSLGNALKSQGRAEEALSCYREALRLKPDFREAHSSLLFALNYPAGVAGDTILAEHRAFGAAFAPPPHEHPNDPDPRRTIRLGYLSADFRDHAVSRFLEPVLENRDRSAFELFCYANVSAPDRHTAYLSRFADHWRDLSRLSDDEAAAVIREDGIDILVDLSGHTAGNRLPLLARKPAPVQVTWLGYPQTTGVAAIDYRITDEISDPLLVTDRLHTERLLRLPGIFTCFAPPAGAPEVAPLPARGSGCITFGSFNNPAKITPETVALWSSVMRELPSCRMLVKGYSLADRSTRERLAALFEREGIPSSRLILRGNTKTYAEHLSLYAAVDIALDTFPYNGTTTTCEALWMGVPVVTLAGKEHRARVGATLLTAVGLPELVAPDAEHFRQAALSLACDTDRLARLRASLRAMMADSPLLDGAGFAERMEHLLRTIWEKWCSEQGSPVAGRNVPAEPEPPAPVDRLAAARDFLQHGFLDRAMSGFLAALQTPGEAGAALSGMEQTLNAQRDRELVEELNRGAALVGAATVAVPPERIADATLLQGAQALLPRGFVTAADLLCRHLLDRDCHQAALHRTLGDVAREIGADGEGAAQYQRAIESGDKSTGTSIALIKARESERHRALPKREKFLLVKAWGFGFWSDIGHLLGGLLLAELSGRTPVVHWGGNSLFSDDPAKNAFETFFEALPHPTLRDLAATCRSFYPEKWHAANLAQEAFNVWDGPGSRLSALRALNRPEEVVVSDFHFSVHDLVPWIGPGHWLHGMECDAVCRALFERYLKVRPEIAEEVEDFYRRRMAGRTLIAVHARGGDKGGEDPNLERLNALYAPYLDRFLRTRPEAGIFLLTDDETLLARFSASYGERIICRDAVRTADARGVHYQQGASRYRLGREVLVDLLLALRCQAFLGNGFSNVSCAAAQLKGWQPGSCTLLGARLDRMRSFTMYRS